MLTRTLIQIIVQSGDQPAVRCREMATLDSLFFRDSKHSFRVLEDDRFSGACQPNFDDGVELHQLLDRITRASDTGREVSQ